MLCCLVPRTIHLSPQYEVPAIQSRRLPYSSRRRSRQGLTTLSCTCALLRSFLHILKGYGAVTISGRNAPVFSSRTVTLHDRRVTSTRFWSICPHISGFLLLVPRLENFIVIRQPPLYFTWGVSPWRRSSQSRNEIDTKAEGKDEAS